MSGLPLPLVVASIAIDAAVAAAALSWPWPQRADGEARTLGGGRLIVAVLVTGVAFLAKRKVLRRAGVGLFGWMNLAYLDLVLLVPAIGAVLLLGASRRWPGGPRIRLGRAARLAALASPALLLVGVDASWVEPFRLRVEEAEVALPGREGAGPVRIGVLTDLQTDAVGDHERRAVDLLMARRPDVILLPGDVFQGTAEQFEATRPALRELLGRLKAPGGVYLVLGDADRDGGHLREIVEAAGIRLLVNEVARVTVGGRRLAIGGVELKFDGGPARDLVRSLEAGGDEGETRILLAHRPDAALGLRAGSRVDLVVAGHTHGGQVVVPGFGPPVTFSEIPRAVAAGGLHRIRGNPIYVSRGVGCERGQAPRIRFLCPPEVSLIELAAPGAGGAGGPPTAPPAGAPTALRTS